MIAKICQYFRERSLGYKQKRYMELLKEFDHPNVGLEHYPAMLTGFWSQFDVSTLKGISQRDWMYIRLSVRHANIAELIYAVQDFTNAIAQDDYRNIELASKERFTTTEFLDLDTYLSGLNGEILNPIQALQSLKDNLTRHGEIIATVQSKAYARFLHRFYQDILALTTVLVKNIKA